MLGYGAFAGVVAAGSVLGIGVNGVVLEEVCVGVEEVVDVMGAFGVMGVTGVINWELDFAGVSDKPAAWGNRMRVGLAGACMVAARGGVGWIAAFEIVICCFET